MLTNLAYFKLLKSLPDDTLSNVNSQLVLLAAAGALNKVDTSHLIPRDTTSLSQRGASKSSSNDQTTTTTTTISNVEDMITSDLLKQQGLLECLAAQLPCTLPLPVTYHRTSPSPPTTSAQASTAAVTSVPSSPERNSSPDHVTSTPGHVTSTPGHVTPISGTDITTSLDVPQQTSDKGTFQAINTSPASSIKEEPKSPQRTDSTSPKASFRPVINKSSSPSSTTVSSTVHWGSSSGPPPNKTCTSTTSSSISKLHPCDTSILSLLSSYKSSSSVESSLQKSFLQNCESSTSGATSSLTNINWSSTGSLSVTGSAGTRRSYNCYWMSHVGPCNRQFRDKDDLYKHLKTHVNDLEALTPATAILQPLTPNCPNCDINRSPFAKVHGRYQPYSKCSKFSRCSCRR